MRDVSQTQCKDKTREKQSWPREKESQKAPPDMSESRRARRERGTKPDQKRRISALSRGFIQQKDELAKFKSVGTAARVRARE